MYNILEEEAEKCLFRLTSFTERLFERFLTGTREPASFVKIPETEKICQKNQLTTPYFWQLFSPHISVYLSRCFLQAQRLLKVSGKNSIILWEKYTTLNNFRVFRGFHRLRRIFPKTPTTAERVLCCFASQL